MENKKITWIISNYNFDPNPLIDCLKGKINIYNQGHSSFVKKRKVNFRQTKHTGHNLSDYLLYIIENYDNLPENLGFIKGNIFVRHIDKKEFLKRINYPGLIPLYSKIEVINPVDYKPIYSKIFKNLLMQQIIPGVMIEKNNDWYTKKWKKGKFNNTFNSFYEELFPNRAPLDFIPFVPGACMIVPRERILNRDLNFYKKVYEKCTYEFFPVEAYFTERAWFLLFNDYRQ